MILDVLAAWFIAALVILYVDRWQKGDHQQPRTRSTNRPTLNPKETQTP
jgi:hypothetical protein